MKTSTVSIALLYWVITTSVMHEGREIPAVVSREYGTFSNHTGCMAALEGAIVQLQEKGVVERTGKYETRNAHGYSLRWECEEKAIPGASPSIR